MDGRLPFEDITSTPTPAPAGPRLYTVASLTARLKSLVELQVGSVAVEGEISNCRPATSGHIYFTLKDDTAQIRAVMFRTTARLLKFTPQDGQRVVARGRIGVYPTKGEYQIVCDALEPHGLGALQLAFEQLKKRLGAEGLFDAARKRPLPVLPRRIGIVTSIDGAALRDILRVLTARHPDARVVIRPARVQGEDAAFDLVRALGAIGKVPEIDVVIIGRGGGSAEDLWAFNDERLARAIAACPVPVISAVGHEVDFTIADFVADVRAATPSNAAELVVDRADNFRTRIDRATHRLSMTMRALVERRQQAAARAAMHLRQWPTQVVLRDRDGDSLRRRLDHAMADRLARARERTAALERRLGRRDVRRVAAEWRARLVGAEGRLRHRALAIRAAADLRVRVTLAEGELACRVEPETS